MSDGTLDIDFDDVNEDPQPMEVGRKTGIITNVPEVVPTNKGDKEKIVLEIKVISPEEDEGSTIQDHITLNQKTRIKRVILACGLTPAKGFDLSSLTGCQLDFMVNHREYKPAGELDENGDPLVRIVPNIRDYIIPTS